ncbi:pilus assembly protein [Vibrio sp. IRLE0018]|uniref:TadE/TadG family type IV pilus assembly protein n=1 Tax=Vibrio TaxID=662 RepID=UPI001A2E8420|nr:pilus assembly protein [Vibrio floridensis]NVC64022.1 pilus assembly protein [Vibrio sp. 05-20-BW147]HAS6347995.1 pilus assembly protein [Vibrio vulnificus]HAS6350348.1 pilus assembly protein [Vibrio vulnificus]
MRKHGGRSGKKVQGLAVIELTIVSTVLMLILLSIFSIGYYMFSIQMINEATRKAARLATVCYVTSTAHQNVKNTIINSSLPSNFSDQHLVIEYLDANGDVVAGDPTDNDVFITIKYVRARVSNYQFQFVSVLNFLGNNGLVTIPEFETTLPVESLGVVRPNKNDSDGSTTDC